MNDVCGNLKRSVVCAPAMGALISRLTFGTFWGGTEPRSCGPLARLSEEEKALPEPRISYIRPLLYNASLFCVAWPPVMESVCA